MIFSAGQDPTALAQVSTIAKSLEPEKIFELINALGNNPNQLCQAQPALDAAVRQLAKHPLDNRALGSLADLYFQLRSEDTIRNSLLFWLGANGSPKSLESWAQLITQSPPANSQGLVYAFSPLFNCDDIPDATFEALATHGIAHPEIATASMDLMNFHTREGNVKSHPALARAQQLTVLLGNVVQQMTRIEEGNLPQGLDPQELSQKISESVALTVSLCDAVALMGHEPAIGKLNQAVGLKHRRIQTEAAAALARLGSEEGSEALCKLAAEPIARMRVLKYAEELELTDKIPGEYVGETAIAESQLATWLAEPTQMGIPPSSLELLDNRELYWPSYEHPVQCYLFRFVYGTNPSFSNIGIAGPVTHAFSRNLESLPIIDAYAAFAGWQAEHEEIFQLSWEQAQQHLPRESQDLQDRLENSEFEDCEIEFAGRFFGELVLLANGIRNQQPVVLLVDHEEIYCFTSDTNENRIDGKLAFMIWRGRKLLEQFNEKV